MHGDRTLSRGRRFRPKCNEMHLRLSYGMFLSYAHSIVDSNGEYAAAAIVITREYAAAAIVITILRRKRKKLNNNLRRIKGPAREKQ